jgi:carboxypeptidase C (cathepsin A)
MLLRLASVSVLVAAAAASTKDDDRVASIPGFEAQFQQGLGFDVYSGYLDVQVPKASTGYDSLKIHYELHTCRAEDCPLALWHQGGPGGSAVFGAWTEMGPFQLMAQGPVYNAKNAWNNAAHMLYLESPAGSTIAGAQTGYSTCSINGAIQDACKWTDVTQAVAYAHTIEAFLEKFPEYKGAPLYLTGGSLCGNQVSGTPRHRRDVVSVAASARCPTTHWLISAQARATRASTSQTSPTTCFKVRTRSRSLD